MNDFTKEAENEGLAMGRAFKHAINRHRQPSRGHGRKLVQPPKRKPLIIKCLTKTLAEVMDDIGFT